MTKKSLFSLTTFIGILLFSFSSPSFAAEPTKAKPQVQKPVAQKHESVMQKKLKSEDKAGKFPIAILLYRPNYILPFYYSSSPMQNIGKSPENQPVKHEEFKFQLSLQVPIWKNMISIDKKPISLFVSYTQLSYWQLYTKSAYFRETNYEPQIFLVSNFAPNWLLRVGLDHQSNGRGGEYERSWNRAFLTLNHSYKNWFFSIEPWLLIFKAESSDEHNPHIAKYLGHERLITAYQFPHKIEVSLMLRNVEHAGSYMSEEAALSIPVTKYLKAYVQFFHGYGQSLIEYQHKTTSVGVGIALNNWL